MVVILTPIVLMVAGIPGMMLFVVCCLLFVVCRLLFVVVVVVCRRREFPYRGANFSRRWLPRGRSWIQEFLGVGADRFVNPWGEFTWVFPKIGVPQNGWFIMENPIF